MKMENGAAKNIEFVGYNDLNGNPSLKIAMQTLPRTRRPIRRAVQSMRYGRKARFGPATKSRHP